MAGKTAGATSTPPFVLTFHSSVDGCSRCDGLTRIDVVSDGRRVGSFLSSYPWNQAIPRDPAEHPSRPHYQMMWRLETTDGLIVDANVECLHFAAAILVRDLQHRPSTTDGPLPAGRPGATPAPSPDLNLPAAA